EEGLAHPVEEFTPPLREVVNRLSQRPEGLPQPLAVLPGPEQSPDNDAEEARTPEEPAARQGATEASHASPLHAGQAAKPPEHREQRLEQAQRTSQQAEPASGNEDVRGVGRSEEHTSELQSRENLVCRLLLEKKNQKM